MPAACPIRSVRADDHLYRRIWRRHRGAGGGLRLSLERLEAARTSAEDAASDGDHAVGRGTEGPLRIAVPKGSLKADTPDVLSEAAGLDVHLSCVTPAVT